MSKGKIVRGLIEKYHPQWKILILENGKQFNVNHLPDEKRKILKEGLEVELTIRGKNNVIDIKILSKIKEPRNNRIKINQNKPLKKEENTKKTGIYITPKYLLEYLLESLENTSDNFYLSLNKYAFASVENPKRQSAPQDYEGAFDLFKDGNLKLKIENIPNITSFPNTKELQDFINLYVETIKNLENKGIYKIESKKFKPNPKFILGLGHPSAYEVSMTLHHIYGFPYIPAQAIKGVLRNYFINEFFDLSEEERLEIAGKELKKSVKDIEDLDKEEKKAVYKKIGEEKESLALENPIFQFIFGTQNKEGDIIFFDAMPEENIRLEIDIMNNHFPEYYEDDKNKIPPADWQNPKPIKFLVVKDTPFRIFLGMKKNLSLEKLKEDIAKLENEEKHQKFIKDFKDKLNSKENLLNHLLDHLDKAFEWYGIGAKTSIGYGYLSKEN